MLKIIEEYRARLIKDATRSEHRFHGILREIASPPFIFQHPLILPSKKFIFIDFYLPKQRIAIEVDGSSHEDKGELDAARDATLLSLGISTIRVTNSEVFGGQIHERLRRQIPHCGRIHINPRKHAKHRKWRRKFNAPLIYQYVDMRPIVSKPKSTA